MGDDWQPGDLALCIFSGPWKRFSKNRASGVTVQGPRRGEILKVQEVNVVSFKEGVYLNFRNYRPSKNWAGWSAIRFIKVTPEEEDAFDQEVISNYSNTEKEKQNEYL